MDRSTHSRQMPGQQRQGSVARRALLACGCAGIGLMLGGLTPALADEEWVERNDRLIFTYEIYNDGTVDAAWGAGSNPRKVEEGELIPVPILLPPKVAERLRQAEAANYSADVTGGTLEILVFIGGYSVCGSRCHYIEGEKHCHTCP